MKDEDVEVEVCEDEEEMSIGQKIAAYAVVSVFSVGLFTIVKTIGEIGVDLWKNHTIKKELKKRTDEVYAAKFTVLDGGQEED